MRANVYPWYMRAWLILTLESMDTFSIARPTMLPLATETQDTHPFPSRNLF
jgi:hypothetical protein